MGQLRITGGLGCGRRLFVPRVGVRPTLDSVREAVFSMVASRLPGARVLDLYAGSGAYGLESWSRGAERVYCVEQRKSAYRCLTGNIRAVAGEDSLQITAVRDDAARFLRRKSWSAPFDLIFCDPPYNIARQAARELGKALLEDKSGIILSSAGCVVFEQSADEPAELPGGLIMLKDRRYGAVRILIMVPGDPRSSSVKPDRIN